MENCNVLVENQKNQTGICVTEKSVTQLVTKNRSVFPLYFYQLLTRWIFFPGVYLSASDISPPELCTEKVAEGFDAGSPRLDVVRVSTKHRECSRNSLACCSGGKSLSALRLYFQPQRRDVKPKQASLPCHFHPSQGLILSLSPVFFCSME